nr:PREDICTED: xanthine dehydrogenase/oxidase-like [Rhinolophus sinicus]
MNQKKDHTQIILSPSLFNPEDFMPLDPTQEPIFPPELLRLKDAPQKQLRFEGECVTWIQATTLKELLDLKAQHPEAKLVVGNTEIGIEMKFKNKLFPVIVCPAWIPELNSVEHGPEGITFGAACTLSSVEKTLQEAIAKLPAHKTEVFKGVLEQLRWFAGKQVKSVAVSPCSGTLKVLGTGLFLTRQGGNLASAADPKDPGRSRGDTAFHRDPLQQGVVLLLLLLCYYYYFEYYWCLYYYYHCFIDYYYHHCYYFCFYHYW